MNEFTGERVIRGQVNDNLWAEHMSRYALAARLTQGNQVLDIGCGSGYGTAELAQNARFSIGIDVAAEAVQEARSEYRIPNLHFMQGSATALPFPNASFDLITAFEVIEHLSDWSALLAEASRVVRPGGLVLVSTPNKPYYTFSRGVQGPNPFHKHEFDAEEFIAALGSFFPQVQLFLQNHVDAFAFYPYGTFLPLDARLDGSRGTPAEANFFLGVCSHQAILNPRSFVYVPRASNLLWEREMHIMSLERELATAGEERAQVIQKHAELHQYLEQQNHWAKELDAELEGTRANLAEVLKKHAELNQYLEQQNGWAKGLDAELQIAQAHRDAVLKELATAREERDQIIQKHADLNQYLEQQNGWARGLDAELGVARAHLAAVLKELATAREERDQIIQKYDDLNQHLEHQNRWAHGLDAELELAHTEHAAVVTELAEARALHAADLASARKETDETRRELLSKLEDTRKRLNLALEALHKAETTIVERTLWGQRVDQHLRRVDRKLKLIVASRWIKLARIFGLSPKFDEES